MENDLQTARENFIQGMSRISSFWGFPRAMGAIYGAIYLSPEPVTLDELVTLANVSKGAVSTNVRLLERLGMVHRQLKIGDRKDYYVAEADFWKIVRGVLREREKSEFALALDTVSESLVMVQGEGATAVNPDLATFYQQRLQAMQSFFSTLDNLVATFVALDNLRMGSLSSLFTKAAGEGS
ncbi:MAG: hypothetical protein H6658_02560 [Ardenticatenaceae bacterium]|nr:hypothetical protein [Ardenticatenaceae bacterium]